MTHLRQILAVATAIFGTTCALGLIGSEAAAAPASTIVPVVEAWYQPDPSCAVPTGCAGGGLPVAPPSPHPARSMHVGAQAGNETARTYLAFDPPPVSTDASVTFTSLDIPLDLTSADGSSSPEQATVIACTWSGHLPAADGAISAPPPANCSRSAALTFASAPKPHLHADLRPLSDGLSNASGVVLLPDTRKSAATESWRVVFSAHDRTGTGVTPPASLHYAVAQPQAPDAPASLPASLPTPTSDPVGQGFASRPSPQQEFVQPPLAAPTQPSPQVVEPPALQPVNEAQTITVGYAYPQVWLLPLAVLIVVPLATRALLKDLSHSMSVPAIEPAHRNLTAARSANDDSSTAR